MQVLRGVLRVYSWIFEAILCLLAVAVAGVTLLSGNEGLNLGWLPWKGEALLGWMIGLGILGLLCVLLSIVGKARILLFLFALGTFVLLVKGFFWGVSYAFPNPAQAQTAALFTGGALLAAIGAWPVSSPARR